MPRSQSRTLQGPTFTLDLALLCRRFLTSAEMCPTQSENSEFLKTKLCMQSEVQPAVSVLLSNLVAKFNGQPMVLLVYGATCMLSNNTFWLLE